MRKAVGLVILLLFLGLFSIGSKAIVETSTATPCPLATQEPLWVDPVTSPTELLTQTIVIRAGNSEWAQVDTGFAVYTVTGSFNPSGNPAEIEIDLMPAQLHLLEVCSRVKVIEHGECVYGGYTMSTRYDRNGKRLEILQVNQIYYLPLLQR
jgi:hypothetical protein